MNWKVRKIYERNRNMSITGRNSHRMTTKEFINNTRAAFENMKWIQQERERKARNLLTEVNKTISRSMQRMEENEKREQRQVEKKKRLEEIKKRIKQLEQKQKRQNQMPKENKSRAWPEENGPKENGPKENRSRKVLSNIMNESMRRKYEQEETSNRQMSLYRSNAEQKKHQNAMEKSRKQLENSKRRQQERQKRREIEKNNERRQNNTIEEVNTLISRLSRKYGMGRKNEENISKNIL